MHNHDNRDHDLPAESFSLGARTHRKTAALEARDQRRQKREREQKRTQSDGLARTAAQLQHPPASLTHGDQPHPWAWGLGALVTGLAVLPAGTSPASCTNCFLIPALLCGLALAAVDRLSASNCHVDRLEGRLPAMHVVLLGAVVLSAGTAWASASVAERFGQIQGNDHYWTMLGKVALLTLPVAVGLVVYRVRLLRSRYREHRLRIEQAVNLNVAEELDRQLQSPVHPRTPSTRLVSPGRPVRPRRSNGRKEQTP